MEQNSSTERVSRKMLVDAPENMGSTWVQLLRSRHYEVHQVKQHKELWNEIRTFKPHGLVVADDTVEHDDLESWNNMRAEQPNVIIFVSCAMPERSVSRNAWAHYGVSDVIYVGEPEDIIVNRVERVFRDKAVQNIRERVLRLTHSEHFQLNIVSEFLRQTASETSQPENVQVPSKQQELRPEPLIKITRMAQLYDGPTGRMSAQAIAKFLAIPTTRLAEVIGAKGSTIRKTPNSRTYQDALEPIVRSIEIIGDLANDDDEVRRWMNKRHPELGNITPLEVILKGKANILWDMLRGAAMGGFR